MVDGLLTDRAELERLFDELAVELVPLGTTSEIVMVGGSWMLWHAHRASTRDVDSARRLDADLSSAVERIAQRHELRPDWLNDAAAGFWPANADLGACAAVYEHEALVVRTPGPETIFVMKLYRADPQDREDMVALWSRCGFLDPEAAADAFRAAYPHAPEDEHLASYIAEIAAEAER